MIEPSNRFTIDFDPEIHAALRSKTAFDERAAEPTMTYEELLNDLKAHGRL